MERAVSLGRAAQGSGRVTHPRGCLKDLKALHMRTWGQRLIPGPCHLGTAGKGRGGKVSRESSGAAQRSAPDRASLARLPASLCEWCAPRTACVPGGPIGSGCGRSSNCGGGWGGRSVLPVPLGPVPCPCPAPPAPGHYGGRGRRHGLCACAATHRQVSRRAGSREAQGGITARGWREPGKKGAVVRGPPLGSGAFAQLKVTECLCF